MKRMMRRFFKPCFMGLCCLGISAISGAFPSVTKIQDTTVNSSAMTLGSGAPYGYAINGLSFQEEVLWTFNGWQYIAYYNGSKHVCLARRQLPSGAWQNIEFADYTVSTTTDAHNVVSMGICHSDGTIHLSYDHHGAELNYRVSQTGVATNPDTVTWSTALFGPNLSTLSGLTGISLSQVTYPRFWPTPNGDLQFGYRYVTSGNGDWYMADYSAATGSWSNIREVIDRAGTYSDSKISPSSSRCPYLNNVAYGPDGKLHLTWTWRETATGTANHDIMYAYSKDDGYTWYNNNPPAGLRIGTANDPLQGILRFSWLSEGLEVIGLSTGNPSTQQLITLNSSGVKAVTLDSYYGLMNQQTQAIDSQGRVHIVMFHCTDETYAAYPRGTNIWGLIGARRYFHYWRDDKGVWTRNELPFVSGNVNTYVGSRPKLFIRDNGDAYVIYQSWQTVNPGSAGIYITSGNLVIQAATAASQWTDWQIIHTETGPFLGEALADPYRFLEGVLSVMMQETPSTIGGSSPLRVLDFQLNN
jgi:hypothetical protein